MPRRDVTCASGLAAGQPRKPEAALMLDWFYALPPLIGSPLERGSRLSPFSRKRPGERPQAYSNFNMLLHCEIVNVVKRTRRPSLKRTLFISGRIVLNFPAQPAVSADF